MAAFADVLCAVVVVVRIFALLLFKLNRFYLRSRLNIFTDCIMRHVN
jgi:hypothetical protein